MRKRSGRAVGGTKIWLLVSRSWNITLALRSLPRRRVREGHNNMGLGGANSRMYRVKPQGEGGFTDRGEELGIKSTL